MMIYPMSRPWSFRALPNLRDLMIASSCLITLSVSSGMTGQVAIAAETGENVIARVNGAEITETEVDLALSDFGQSLSRYPEEQRRTILIDVLVNLHLLAQEAEKTGIASSPAFERRMAYVRSRTLRDAYFDQVIEKSISDEDIRNAYEEQVVNAERGQEVRARHILVNTEDEAKAVVEQLNGGADFAELAAEKSIGPSKTNGGDLGFFEQGAMVPAFGAAAFALEPGQISAPVQTQFGWHVIKVEEKRTQPAPEFDGIKDQLREYLVRNKFSEVVSRLKEGAAIEIVSRPATKPAGEGSEDNSAAEPTATD